jgi:hypothetical protein
MFPTPLVAPHLLVFAFAWLGYGALLVALPVTYGPLRALDSASGMAVFFLVAFLSASLLDAGGVRRSRRPVQAMLRYGDVHTLIVISLVLSFCGLGFLVVDKVFVQQVDFSQGIAIARELWREEGEARAGVSSIFSVGGYLLAFTFFVPAALTHLWWESLRPLVRRTALVSVALLVFANSLLTGGRSIVLMQIAAFVATGALRALAGRRFFPGRVLAATLYIGTALILAVGYSLYVFSERAAAVGIDPYDYSIGMLAYLGGTPNETFASLDDLPPGISGVLQFGVIAGAYLTHSFGTFESVLDMGTTPGSASLVFARVLLGKLGLIGPIEEEWILTGRFLSMPGALWYDFGWFGLVLGAVLLGILLGAIRAGFVERGTMFPGTMLGLSIGIIGSALVSPILIGVDMLAFPFMLLGFVIMDVIAWIVGARGEWILKPRAARIVVHGES